MELLRVRDGIDEKKVLQRAERVSTSSDLRLRAVVQEPSGALPH